VNPTMALDLKDKLKDKRVPVEGAAGGIGAAAAKAFTEAGAPVFAAGCGAAFSDTGGIISIRCNPVFAEPAPHS
jgi:NAD(P)-dependent dehydrogenase (short-subunit alcohol dehydrogenase family)